MLDLHLSLLTYLSAVHEVSEEKQEMIQLGINKRFGGNAEAQVEGNKVEP